MALTIFAIGALMLVPSLFAWVNANHLSMQRDEVMRILTQAEDRLAYTTSGSVWSTAQNYSSFNQGMSNLDSVGYTQWNNFDRPQLGINVSVARAVVGVTDSAGNVYSRIMRLRGTWQGPSGATLSATRTLQRNGPMP